VLAARAVADARRALLVGFTSVRDVVGLGVHLARTVDEGTIPGPHIHGGGAMLTPTAGHGDLHMFPTSYMRTLEAGGHYVQLCDGVAECLRGVRNQLRVGARVIKVCASGGVMSETDHPIHQQFSEDELRAIVGEAGRAERIVAAHWGQNARELIHLVESGMRPLQAIDAETENARMTLGPQAPRPGQLIQGYDADIRAVRKDPRTDVSVLSSSENIRAIWKSRQPIDRGPI